MGHSPVVTMKPQDEILFRAFQSNLLSLISHELRTPLMGILNALSLLDGGDGTEGISTAELVRMARGNAQRLHQTLSMLLDLAAIESGTYTAKLREVELLRLVQGRLLTGDFNFKERGLSVQWDHSVETIVLGDPQKLGRAVDLGIQALIPFATPGTSVVFRISSSEVDLSFELDPTKYSEWNSAWSQGLLAFESGVASPVSAFAGVLQTEQAFLTRSQEGLGSEFLLIHEAMRLHQAKLLRSQDAESRAHLTLSFPALTSEDALLAVLMSRAYSVSTGLNSVALVLFDVPNEISTEEFRAAIKANLFRTSDGAYSLPARGQVALVLEDCKPEDATGVAQRLEKRLGKSLRYGMAQCPIDGLDPKLLLSLASERMKK